DDPGHGLPPPGWGSGRVGEDVVSQILHLFKVKTSILSRPERSGGRIEACPELVEGGAGL
ncbi:MAG: hypothetical protein ACETWR_13800, partial [Anaerolineae bacterium]